MSLYHLEATDTTPEVTFDDAKAELVFDGESYPENVTVFFEPLLEKLKSFLEDTDRLTVIFRLSYFNTSSAKYFYDLLSLLEESKKLVEIKVFWYYREDDDVMHEHGEDFQIDFDLSFELVAVSEA